MTMIDSMEIIEKHEPLELLDHIGRLLSYAAIDTNANEIVLTTSTDLVVEMKFKRPDNEMWKKVDNDAPKFSTSIVEDCTIKGVHLSHGKWKEYSEKVRSILSNGCADCEVEGDIDCDDCPLSIAAGKVDDIKIPMVVSS